MNSIRSLIDQHTDVETDETKSLYKDLSPVYDFIYQRHYDYTVQLQTLQKYSNLSRSTVIEGACGTGGLSSILAKKSNAFIGFDIHSQMLQKAKVRNQNSTFIKMDLRNLGLNIKADLYTVMGNSAVHLTEESDVNAFLSNAANILKESGKLIFDCMPTQNMIDGYTSTKTFHSDKYRIQRTTSTSRINNSPIYNMEFVFQITDTSTEETITLSDNIYGRTYNPHQLKNRIESHNFSSTHILSNPTEGPSVKDLCVIAIK